MPRKILIFSLAYYPRFVSGAEAAIREITDRIEPSDIEFHMVTLRFDSNDPQEERIANVHVHRVGIGSSYLSKVLFIPLAVWRARALHRSMRFDGVWAMMTYMLVPIALMRLFGTKIPHALTLQDGDPYEKVFGRWHVLPLLPFIDYGFKTATVVQVISRYLGEWPKRRGFSGPIELVYNGADPRDVDDSVSKEEIATLAQKLGKKDGDIYLVNTARLEHQKAFDVVIQALSKLPAHIKLLIVGSGTEEAALRALADELKLKERVLFVGQVDRQAVTAYRKVSDIFVAPSRSEGLGNAFLSALASKLPVVSTQEGGLAEFIFDREHNPDKEPTAWVVEKDDPVAIVRAVEDILANPKKVTDITLHAREMVLARFGWKGIAEAMRTRVFEPLFK